MKLFRIFIPVCLQTVLSGMYQVRHSTRIEEREETIVTSDEDENGLTKQIAITKMVLEIEITQKAAAEMAAAYACTPRLNNSSGLSSA